MGTAIVGPMFPTEMNPVVIGLIAFVAVVASLAALGQMLERRERGRR
jgi:hypothetical protein